jgi:hypothetical protein
VNRMYMFLMIVSIFVSSLCAMENQDNNSPSSSEISYCENPLILLSMTVGTGLGAGLGASLAPTGGYFVLAFMGGAFGGGFTGAGLYCATVYVGRKVYKACVTRGENNGCFEYQQIV